MFEDEPLHVDELEFSINHDILNDTISTHEPSNLNNLSTNNVINNFNFINAPSRTVYLGNLPSDITLKKLLNRVNCGIIEDCKIINEKNCALITFVDDNAALLFHSDCILRRLIIGGNDIKIGWGKNNIIDPVLLHKIKNEHVTRNVYLGNCQLNERQIRNDFNKFGNIDCIDVVKDKKIVFVHFASILQSLSCVENLTSINANYQNMKIAFGKDRCNQITKLQQYNVTQFLGITIDEMSHDNKLNDRNFINNTLLQQVAATAAIDTSSGGPNNMGNRTIYIGNLPQGTKIEEICNIVRGGMLQSIKLLNDISVCFITFIDATLAAQFFAMCSIYGIIINRKRCKIGWGKHSGPLPQDILENVIKGATRNLYIGQIKFTDETDPSYKLFKDADTVLSWAQEFGEIEQINFLPNSQCCFINYTNVQCAIAALQQLSQRESLQSLKLNFGKDRCGNLASHNM